MSKRAKTPPLQRKLQEMARPRLTRAEIIFTAAERAEIRRISAAEVRRQFAKMVSSAPRRQRGGCP